MTTIGYLSTLGIRKLSTGLAQTVEWRASSAGTWATLTDALFEVAEVVPTHDETAKQDVIQFQAALTVPEDGQLLLHGYEIRVNASSDIWAVYSGPIAAGQNRYLCTRTPRLRIGADRGQVRK